MPIVPSTQFVCCKYAVHMCVDRCCKPSEQVHVPKLSGVLKSSIDIRHQHSCDIALKCDSSEIMMSAVYHPYLITDAEIVTK